MQQEIGKDKGGAERTEAYCRVQSSVVMNVALYFRTLGKI